MNTNILTSAILSSPSISQRPILYEFPEIQCNTAQHRTVEHSTVQYSTVQYGTVRYGTVRYGTVRYGTVQYSKVHAPFYTHKPGYRKVVVLVDMMVETLKVSNR